jgi:hypothetical protein
MKLTITVLLFGLLVAAQVPTSPDKNAITSQERMEFLKIVGASEMISDEAARASLRLELAEEIAATSRSKDNAAILQKARTEAALMKRLQDKINAAFQALADRAIASRGFKKGEAGFDPNVGVVPIPKEKP